MPAGLTTLAASGGGGDSGTFLVSPDIGLMLWLLIVFAVSFFILRKAAFPRIAKTLDDRQRKITDAIDEAEARRQEAQELAAEYREQLKGARGEGEEIVGRARRQAEKIEAQAREDAEQSRTDAMARAKRDIQAEERRALGELRSEVATLTIAATAKVTRKSLDDADQRRLVDEALDELDFSSLTHDAPVANGSSSHEGGSSADDDAPARS